MFSYRGEGGRGGVRFLNSSGFASMKRLIVLSIVSIVKWCGDGIQILYCGGTGMDSTVPSNTVQVPNSTGTETNSGSVNTGFIGEISGYIYRTGKL